MDRSISASELVERIEGGQSVYVLQAPNEQRRLSIKGRLGSVLKTFDLDRDAYEDLLRETVTALAADHGTKIFIAIKSDHYGRSRVKIRSGRFGWKKSRLVISPRHVALLERLMVEPTHGSTDQASTPAMN